jgi:nucleotide-binding universal stress UspA family protein
MASTISDKTLAERAIAHATTRKILIAMYGRETAGWAREVSRSAPRSGPVRVLVVEEGSGPAFTSLLPVARRRFGAALTAWRQEVEGRRGAVLEALLPDLPESAEVVRVRSAGDLGRTIADAANAWPADVVLVGHDCRGAVERALTGRVHERVVRFAWSSVLVIAADPLADAVAHMGRRRLPWHTPVRGGV